MNNAQTAQIIKDECKKKGVPISTLLTECNIRKSLIYDLEKRDYTPSAKVISKIANYLDVPTDYLLGRIDESPEVNQSDDPENNTIEIIANVDIFDKIFTLLSEKNITAAKMSKDIGISSGLISQWEKGLQKPSFNVVFKIADYLGVSIDYLLGRSEIKYNTKAMVIDIYDEQLSMDIDRVKLERGFKSRELTFQYILQLGFEHWESRPDQEDLDHVIEISKEEADKRLVIVSEEDISNIAHK